MVIRRSAAEEISQLVDRLTGADQARREAASARLAIIGARAVGTLTRALDAELPPEAQTAILRTLEAIHDPRGVAPAARLVDAADIDVASAAVGVLRGYLRSPDAAIANVSFERLTAVTLDPTWPAPVRAAALEALSDLPAATTAQVLRELENDPSRRFRTVAARPPENVARPARLAEVTASARCPDPRELRAMLAEEGASAPLALLRRLVEMVRERETAETGSPRRAEWQVARAAVHQTLAARRSRLALYDLRETLAAVPGPLPVGFLAALEAIGDATCLNEVAAAYIRARQSKDAWWTEHLANAFRAIVRRERLRRRSTALRQVAAKWPQAVEELLPRRRT